MAISLWELRSYMSLKDAASGTEGIIRSSVNHFRKKSEYLSYLLRSYMNENTFTDCFFFPFDLFVSLFFSSVCIFMF